MTAITALRERDRKVACVVVTCYTWLVITNISIKREADTNDNS